MHITMGILYALLSPEYRCRTEGPVSDRPLRSLLLYTGVASLRDALYVARGEDLRTPLPEGCSVLCAGKCPAEMRGEGELLVVEDPGDFFTFFNRVQALRNELELWNERMEIAAADTADARRLLSAAREKLPWSLVLLNAFLAPIAAETDAAQFPKERQDALFSSLLLSDSALSGTEVEPGTHYFRNEQLGLEGFCRGYSYGGEFRGKLLAIRAAGEPVTDAQRQLFDMIALHAERVFRYYSRSAQTNGDYLLLQHTLAAVLLNPGNVSRPDCVDALKLIGWNVNDRYRLFFFPFYDSYALAPQANFLITLLENRLSSGKGQPATSRGLVINDGVVWVVNRDAAPGLDIRELCQELSDTVKSMGGKVGLSSECRDFFSLHLYLKQAQSAIIMGSAADPDQSLYNFRQYSLFHILNSAYAPYDPMDVIHPAIIILMRYDRQNGTEYCTTLRTFMACRYNVLKASAQLYIHRSTFTVRIKRIEELCAMNLEDERTRLHLLLSYYILESGGIRFDE